MRATLGLTVLLTSLSTLAADRAADGKAFVQALADGKFELAAATFAPVMQKAMSPAKLRTTWDGLLGSTGAFKGIGEARTHTEAGFDVVLVRCTFARAPLDVKVVYDAQGLVSGLWFQPAVEAPVTPAPPDVREVPVVVGEKGVWPLPGTLALPANAKGRLPAVVLVHGSGPNDRDETVGACRPFRDLAFGLAQRGVVTLRYEKRTRVHGAKMTAADARFTVKDETVDDALTAVALLRARPEVDPSKVVVLGHSLGGYLAPRIGAADPKLAGLVVLAGSTRPLEVLVVEQLKTLGAPADKVREAEQTAAQIAAFDGKSTASAMGAPASYWLDLKGYDPVADAKKLKVPMLVLQGGRDYQVSPTRDFSRWKVLEGPRVVLKLYPGLNHLFVSGEGPSVPAEYAKEGHVASAVLDDVAAWVKAR